MDWSNLDLERFNYIAMPLISLLALAIYAWILKSGVKQNRISSSTSLIPYYEQEIQQLIADKKDVKFFEGVMGALHNLNQNKAYLEDIRNGDLGAGMGLKELKERPYRYHLVHLYPILDEDSSINRYYRNLEYFIEEIMRSELIDSHKMILKRKIRREVTFDLFLFRFKVQQKKSEIPEVLPAPYLDTEDYWASFKLYEIEFFQRIQRLEKMLTLN